MRKCQPCLDHLRPPESNLNTLFAYPQKTLHFGSHSDRPIPRAYAMRMWPARTELIRWGNALVAQVRAARRFEWFFLPRVYPCLRPAPRCVLSSFFSSSSSSPLQYILKWAWENQFGAPRLQRSKYCCHNTN